MNKELNYLDRNEFNFTPSDEVVNAIKNFDIRKLAFYTRIYDEGKKSIFSEFLAEYYGIDEKQILLGYGAEDLLKMAVHYFLTGEDGNRKMFIPKFSWWYYKSIADEVNGNTMLYPVYETNDSFAYDFEALKKMIDEEQPKIMLVASPNNPTGNGLTVDELELLAQMLPETSVMLVDEAYASYVTSDISYIKDMIERPPPCSNTFEKAATGAAKVRACASSDFRSGQSYCTFVFWRIADSIADLLDMVAFLLLSLCFFVIKVVKCALSEMGHFTLSAPSIECILYHKVWHMIS